VSKKSPYKKGGLFEGANPLVFELAKDLRRNMTHAETILWMHLKAGIKGLKVRRQHPIGNYVADFCCFKLKLIIEVDGAIHKNERVKAYDTERQTNLEKLGYEFLRFQNQEIEKDIESALSRIDTKAEVLLQT
jgi:cyclase